jgi:SPP1 family predicted phage head-tail adaptor
MINAGQLRDRIIIQAPIEVDDGVGGKTRTWTAGIPVRAKVVPLTGSEVAKASILNGVQAYQITIRFREGVGVENRIMLAGAPLNIDSVVDPDRRREALLITAEAGVGT